MQIKNILLANVAFSLFCSVVMLFGNKQLQSLFHFDIWYVFPAIAGLLVGFIVLILYVVLYQSTHAGWVKTISIMDLGWVIGSIMLIVMNPFDFPGVAQTLVGVVALCVGTLGSLQWYYIYR